MEFEDYKAAWQKRKLEQRSIFDKFPNEIAADIERQAARLRRQQLVSDSVSISLLAAVIIAFLALIAAQTSVVLRAGTVLVMIGVVSHMLLSYRSKHPERRRKLHLPMRESLLEERKEILDKIRSIKRQTAISALPVVGGIALLGLSPNKTEQFFLGFIITIFLLRVLALFARWRRTMRQQNPVLREIDRDLGELDELLK